MIYTAIDGIFRFVMWMLLDPSGRAFFLTCDTGAIIACVIFLWVTRNDK